MAAGDAVAGRDPGGMRRTRHAMDSNIARRVAGAPLVLVLSLGPAPAAPARPAAAPQQAPTDAKDEKDGAKKERVIKPLTPGCARPVMIHRASKYFLVNL